MPGTIEILQFDSVHLGRKRKLRVWRPDDFDASRPHLLLLQHDGQMAFTDRDADLPFGSWGIDEWVSKLAGRDGLRPTIVIGIDNSAKRRSEFFPLTEDYPPYEKFLIEELIPWARGEFPIEPGPRGVATMGSSMGGMVGFSLAFNHPGEVGAVAALSPWFEYENNRYIHEVLRPAQEMPPIRVYMDSGIRDWRHLDDGHRGMLLARLELLRLGFVEGDDLDILIDTWFASEPDLKPRITNPEKIAEATWNQHNEFYWRRRLERPLRWVMKGIEV